MPFIGYVKHANKNRFTAFRTWDTLEQATEEIGDSIPENTTSAFQIRHGSKVVWESVPNTNPRSIEPIVGQNLQILKFKVDKFHVGESYLSVVREIKSGIRNWHSIPRPLRRGFIQAVLRQHLCNRMLYRSVMG